MEKNRTLKSYLHAGIVCLLFVMADQYTKYLAIIHLKGKASFELIPGVFELQYLENRGAAFGLFQDRQVFFHVGRSIDFFHRPLFLCENPTSKTVLPDACLRRLDCRWRAGKHDGPPSP